MGVAPNDGVPHENIRSGNQIEQAAGGGHVGEGGGGSEDREESAGGEGVFDEARADHASVYLSELRPVGAAFEEEEEAAAVAGAPWVGELLGRRESPGLEVKRAHLTASQSVRSSFGTMALSLNGSIRSVRFNSGIHCIHRKQIK